ncbi:hypothetical protein AB0F91_06100 [Amycolatopsis sp. NPDC023774]|uniref:hypothetical protein n=1 Tax=Amycolatopsis sp. NPDC023774 TaxID=3155015 RepID=UPI00340845F1
MELEPPGVGRQLGSRGQQRGVHPDAHRDPADSTVLRAIMLELRSRTVLERWNATTGGAEPRRTIVDSPFGRSAYPVSEVDRRSRQQDPRARIPGHAGTVILAQGTEKLALSQVWRSVARG